MDIVKIRVTQCENDVEVLKLIHKFDKSLPLSEIKRRLAEKDDAFIFDFDGYDWLDETERGITANDYERTVLRFLDELEKLGADYEIRHNDEKIDRTLLENTVERHEDIRQECEEYPD